MEPTLPRHVAAFQQWLWYKIKLEDGDLPHHHVHDYGSNVKINK